MVAAHFFRHRRGGGGDGGVLELESRERDKSGMENVSGLSTNNIGWIDEMGSKPVYAFLV